MLRSLHVSRPDCPVENAVELANLAAGIVVSKVGTVPIAAHELVAALTPSTKLAAQEKILDRDRLLLRVAEWRASGKASSLRTAASIFSTWGHITLLEDCRRFGSKLVLGLNSGRFGLPPEGACTADR